MTDSETKIVQEVLRGTVKIHASPKQFNMLRPFIPPRPSEGDGGVGTGFFVASDSDRASWFTVLTCFHVVSGCRSTDVTISLPGFGQEQIPVVIIGVSPEYDLALLAVELTQKHAAGITILDIASDADLHVGEHLRACGYPLGQRLKLTEGTFNGYQDGWLQHTASINGGNSGGPLINKRGLVVGINNAGIPAASSVHFAIPSAYYTIWSRIFMNNNAPIDHPSRVHIRPSFGVFWHPRATDQGITVFHIRKNSPLCGKIQEGDVIKRVVLTLPNGSKKKLNIDAYGEIEREDNFILPNSQQPIQLSELIQRLPFDTMYSLHMLRQPKQACSLRGGAIVLDPVKEFEVANIRPAPLGKEVGCSKILVPPFDTVDFSLLFGCCFMDMNAGHISEGGEFAMYYMNMTPEERAKDQFVVTHVFSGSRMAQTRAIRRGMVLCNVNGCPVRNISDFRRILTAGRGKGMELQFRSGELLVMGFNEWIETERVMSQRGGYAPDRMIMEHAMRTTHQRAPEGVNTTSIVIPTDQFAALLQQMQRSGFFKTDGNGQFLDTRSGRVVLVAHGLPNGFVKLDVRKS